MENYYHILNVDNNASQKQIKQAYLNLIKMYHPDVYKGDKTFAEKKTAEITLAYSVLKNYIQRKNYDEKLQKQQEYNNQQAEKKYPFTSATKSSEAYKEKKQKQAEAEFLKNNKKAKKDKNCLKTFFSKIFKAKPKMKEEQPKKHNIKQTPKVKIVKVDVNKVNVIKKNRYALSKEEAKEKVAFDLSIAFFVSLLFLVIVLAIIFS